METSPPVLSDLLRRHWKHDTFREPQLDIIRSVLDGKDTLALLPTGGGKSLCFQLPALVNPGICVVVSPLIALMKDQVDSLARKDIKALALTGGLKEETVSDLLDNARFGGYKFLYLSPERLQSEWIRERLAELPVNLIAVDEAHCISQWGHDFRPAYRDIAFLRELFPKVPLLAVTGSATPEVVDDITVQLGMKEPQVFRKSFARPNIAYGLVQTDAKTERAVEMLSRAPGSAIVYVRNRKACLDFAAQLGSRGITATYYHGGLSPKEKDLNMAAWMRNERQVMVATNAFGMGIDKPDVRLVLHLQLPENLENYYQESGRAGRDGHKSFSVLLVGSSDPDVARRQFLDVLPDKAFLKRLYLKLCQYLGIAYGEGYGESYDFNLNAFCLKHDLPVINAYQGLEFLDRQAVLSFSREFHAHVQLRFLLPSKELIRYMSLNRSEENLIHAIVRGYPGVYEQPVNLQLGPLSRKAGMGEEKMLSLFEKWRLTEIAEYKSAAQDASVLMLEPREDERTINRVSGHLKSEYDRKRRQLEAVLEYASHHDRCKSKELLTYFGETTQDCGICSYCVQKTKSADAPKALKERLLQVLQHEHLDSNALEFRTGASPDALIFALRGLLQEGKIAFAGNNRYTAINK